MFGKKVDAMDVLIESKRDERTLAWLLDELRDEAVTAACQRLAGNRRAYVSHVAKALGASPPKTLATVPAPEALDRIRQTLDALGDAS